MLFGEVVEGLSRLGDAIDDAWGSLTVKYPNIELDESVIMPNHFHALLAINPSIDGSKPPTLGSIMGFFKYQTTAAINSLRGTPGMKVWQRGYFDHVVRTNRSLDRIRDYIRTNPARWGEDAENPTGSAKDDVRRWVLEWDVAAMPVLGGENRPVR